MAKTLTLNMNGSRFTLRQFGGDSLYWNTPIPVDADVSSAQVTRTAANASPIGIDGFNQFVGSNDYRMLRLLFKIDLADLPANAVITSALLRVRIQDNPFGQIPSMSPITLAIYRLLRTVNFSVANMQIYDTAKNWSAFGMKDGDDYKLTAEVTGQITSAQSYPQNVTFDVTALAQFAIQSDAKAMFFTLTRSDAHRRSFPCIGNTNLSTVNFRMAIEAGPDNPTLTVVYTDPMTFHPANADGTINEAVEIDTTAGGLHYFESIAVGAEGAAKKFFVKNRLASESKNLKIMSQTSRGAKVYEVDRTSCTGNGVLSDIGTVDKSADATNYTRSERWRIIFESGDVALSQYHVYRDNGSFDDPTVADAWSAASPATGSLGSLYTSAERGVSFTLSSGGTAFVDGDIIIFPTYEDDAQDASPADSDDFVEIAPDVANAPGTFQKLKLKVVKVTSAVSNGTSVPVTDASVFKAGTTIRFSGRATGTIQDRTIDTVNVGTNTVTVTAAITLAQDDYAEAVPIGTATLTAGGTFPFWMKPVSPAGSSRETKYPRFRAEAD